MLMIKLLQGPDSGQLHPLLQIYANKDKDFPWAIVSAVTSVVRISAVQVYYDHLLKD